MAVIWSLYSYVQAQNVVEITDTGEVYCFGTQVFVPSASIPDNCAYLRKDSNGNKVCGVDAYGNVYMAEQVHIGVLSPVVTSISPTYGTTAGGTTITIKGANFIDGSTTCTIDGDACTNFSFTDSGEFTVDTPAGDAGAQNLKVTLANMGWIEIVGAFTYSGSPTITDTSPASGNAGTAMTITGTNFWADTMAGTAPTVTVGGTAATNIVFHNSTEIVCRAPTKANGTYDVVVTNPDGQSATDSNAFQYVTSPTVTSIVPFFGLTAGGEEVVITGTGFAAGATVTIGGGSCTSVVVDSDTQITCNTPTGSAGATRNVVVTNSDGGQGTGYDLFEFFAQDLATFSDAAGADAAEFAANNEMVVHVNSLGSLKCKSNVIVGFD